MSAIDMRSLARRLEKFGSRSAPELLFDAATYLSRLAHILCALGVKQPYPRRNQKSRNEMAPETLGGSRFVRPNQTSRAGRAAKA